MIITKAHSDLSDPVMRQMTQASFSRLFGVSCVRLFPALRLMTSKWQLWNYLSNKTVSRGGTMPCTFSFCQVAQHFPVPYTHTSQRRLGVSCGAMGRPY